MADEAQAFNEKISRQRIDYFELPGGKGIRAVLTVTLPGGKEYQYTEDVTAAEAAGQLAVEGDFDDFAVAGIFGDIGKALGKVAKGAVKAVKSIASSKVFKTAAKGLAVVAPALGPLAPAALTASAAMMTTSHLVGARHAASRGNKKAAAAATAAAVKTARALSPKHAKTLLKIANEKSKAVDKHASKMTGAQKRSAAHKSKAIVTKTKPKPSTALARGKQLHPQDLVRAARAGRVYVVQAA